MLCGLKTILTDMNILNSYRHIRPKKVKYPIPEIPDDSGKKSGTDWVLPKIIGSGRVSGTRQALLSSDRNEISRAIQHSVKRCASGREVGLTLILLERRGQASFSQKVRVISVGVLSLSYFFGQCCISDDHH